MTKVIVYHGGYGCDTGCCGHWVQLESGEEKFFFSHPYTDNFEQFAREQVADAFGEEHVADLDWENCVIVDD